MVENADCRNCEDEGFVLVHKTKEIVRCPACTQVNSTESRLTVPVAFALDRRTDIA